jgi:hypothetical protein
MSEQKSCSDDNLLKMNQSQETCYWQQFGCGDGRCLFLTNESVGCDDYDYLTVNLENDTCSWKNDSVSTNTCKYGCRGEGCCFTQDTENLDCDNYDSASGNLAIDYEASNSTCVYGCHGKGCCEQRNKTCDNMCDEFVMDGKTYYCDGKNWTAQTPYCCYGDKTEPKIIKMTDDGNIYDNDTTGYKICAEVTDECPLNVTFSYKFYCHPFSDWFGYQTKVNNTYCFEIPRDVWIDNVGRNIYFKIYARDFVGNDDITTMQLGGIIYDDDVKGPTYFNPVYSRWVNFSLPIPVKINITDLSGISSAVLHYDYDYYTGEDGLNDTPSVNGNVYTFNIPAPGHEYKADNLKFWIIATDNDTDRANDTTSSRFDSMSMYIDPPDEETKESNDNFYIQSYTPSDSTVNMIEGSSFTFSVVASSTNGVTYTWTLDGNKVSDTTDYTFYPKNDDVGTHSVSVTVSNGTTSDSKSWVVNVENFICEGEVTPQSPQDGGSVTGSSNDGNGNGGGSNGKTENHVENTTFPQTEVIKSDKVYSIINTTTGVIETMKEQEKKVTTGMFSMVETLNKIGAFVFASLFVVVIILVILIVKKHNERNR